MVKPDNWELTTDGHRGDIILEPASYQTIYLNPLFPPREGVFITIQNNGPSDLKIWFDTWPLTSTPIPPTPSFVLDPFSENIDPRLILNPGQCATVVVRVDLIVRSNKNQKAEGNYVISWCCPHENSSGMGGNHQQMDIPTTTDEKH